MKGSSKRLTLIQLNKQEVSEKELNRLLGGENCCICNGSGESSIYQNGQANHDGGTSGLIKPGGGWGNGAFSG